MAPTNVGGSSVPKLRENPCWRFAPILRSHRKKSSATTTWSPRRSAHLRSRGRYKPRGQGLLESRHSGLTPSCGEAVPPSSAKYFLNRAPIRSGSVVVATAQTGQVEIVDTPVRLNLTKVMLIAHAQCGHVS
jgi:hypothetical protein